jgi:hypothetical protein
MHRGMQRRLAAVGTFLLAVPVAIGLAPTAAMGDEAPPPADQNTARKDLSPAERAQLTSPATAAALRIADIAGGRDHNQGERGFCSVSQDSLANEVDLRWKGRLDDDVAAVLARARKQGVTVRVHPADYTKRSVLKAVGRLLGPELKRAGIDIRTAGPASDCSGINATILVKLSERLLGDPNKRRETVERVGREVAKTPIVSVQEYYEERPLKALKDEIPHGI